MIKTSAPMLALTSRHKACEDCGYIHLLPELRAGEQLSCNRCGAVVARERRQWATRAVALAVTGLVLFVVANTFPFIGLEAAGVKVDSSLLSGVLALLERERWLLSSMIFLFIFLVPLLELCCLSYLAFSYALGQRYPQYGAPALPLIMRTLMLIHPWSMLEIFLLGVLVTSIKLGDMAALIPGIGSIAFVLLVVVLIALHMMINRWCLWRWWRAENVYLSNEDGPPFPELNRHRQTLVSCHCCAAIVSRSLAVKQDSCPRCGSELHFRIRRSLERSLALLLAAIVLYIPANTLPIMSTTQLGQTQKDTIISGVIHLIHLGSWPIALVVFVASVVVPIAKIVVLATLLYAARYGGRQGIRQSTVRYRITEFVGRWSMVDVFVVCLLVALVQFGLLANIEPSGATLAFAAVVVLTMLAAEVFDQRLLWDRVNE